MRCISCKWRPFCTFCIDILTDLKRWLYSCRLCIHTRIGRQFICTCNCILRNSLANPSGKSSFIYKTDPYTKSLGIRTNKITLNNVCILWVHCIGVFPQKRWLKDDHIQDTAEVSSKYYHNFNDRCEWWRLYLS